MSKTLVIAVSFSCGAIFGAFLINPHASSVIAGQRQTASPMQMYDTRRFVPTVPALGTTKLAGMVAVSVAQNLDGLDCASCSFTNTELVYGGGAFRLQDISIQGNTTLKFVGAAANTVSMLEAIGALEKGTAPIPVQADAPIVQKHVIKRPMTKLDISPPFIGQR